MGIFVSNKDILRCPKCGSTYFRERGFTTCIDDGCDLISEDEYEAQGYPKVECPYCHTTNTKKIGWLDRVGSAELWGLGSPIIGKQFHCNNCGADF